MHSNKINTGFITGVNGNMVTIKSEYHIAMNEVIYVALDEETKLKGEVIRIKEHEFDAQIFEETKGIKKDQPVELTRELLSIELGPGLLGQIFDGLGNPLTTLAQHDGYFLKAGSYAKTLNENNVWDFFPVVKKDDIIKSAQTLGIVKEGIFEHRIMVPFAYKSTYKVVSILPKQHVSTKNVVAIIADIITQKEHKIYLSQKWPIKLPINQFEERLLPSKPLTTKIRMIDALFPIAQGGVACIPGPFGSGKTVFLQSISKFADVDIVIIAACGERAGEVVETLNEFPLLLDPKTSRSLMERTIIICNTSSMPTASREASVYTAITIAEYYRQMGLRVLVVADSTSRWAQAVREMSGRLEEIPTQEAFPAYLSSLIANFYERAGTVRTVDPRLGESIGSLTLLGALSPAGGNFEEPVTQATLAVVDCFLGLTYARSYAKKFPAISPIESWSKYLDSLASSMDKIYFDGFVAMVKKLKNYYVKGQKIAEQMKVLGEEDTCIEDFVCSLKSEFFDAVFLQQDAFDDIDASPSEARVATLLKQVNEVIDFDFKFLDKTQAKEHMLRLTSLLKNLNLSPSNSKEYQNFNHEIKQMLFAQNETREHTPNNLYAAHH